MSERTDSERCMANDPYINFLQDPDQVSRQAELATFFGPHGAKFLKGYEMQRAMMTRTTGGKIRYSFLRAGYVWPAFFVGPVWFFYRKMWLWGGILTAVVVVLGLLPIAGRVGFPLGIAMAVGGSSLYLNHAVRTIERLRQASPNGVVDPQQLAAAGGVSKTAGWIGGVVYGLLLLLALYGIIVAIRTGAPLR